MSSERKQYPFRLIEPKWQKVWDEQRTFKAWNPGETIPADHPFSQRHQTLPPKYYILDMFPYPSGAGLHVGHPEGYTATDILARYRRAQGFNVLHPMGWDAFGLPAEQYAIKTGQHPRATTEQNIATFKRQIKSLGFSYDWSREIDTTDPKYFKWSQWIFLQLYNSWFNPNTYKAEPIKSLPYPADVKTDEAKRDYRDSKRLAYVAEAPVNWCPELGTVLANEEVIDGKSEVGGFPVVRRPMRQWMLRITAYAERLLDDLEGIDWSHSLKEMQRNWIGRSEGASVQFQISNSESQITVFTTRPDTLFGATYMVLAPEHPLIDKLTTSDQAESVRTYREDVSRKSDLERTELAKEKTGVFTGGYAINPVTGQKIPVWIADYVLISYGTGAIMAVPGHDTRDLEFAQKFNLPIIQVIQPPAGKDWRGYVDDGISVNSASAELSLNGLATIEAKATITAWLEKKGIGKKTINYKLRDWLFSRQRYWGEPFPIIWRNGNHEALREADLPLMPPDLTDFKPTASGEPPLARAKDWVQLPDGAVRETNTMPQWAGSCWYYLRYLDATNSRRFVASQAERYWMGAPFAQVASTPASWSIDLHALVAYAYDNPGGKRRRVIFAAVGERLAKQIGLDLAGFMHVLDNYAVRHIFREHGVPDIEKLRGQIAVTEADLELLPEIVSAPDNVERLGRNSRGLELIRYSKRFNGTIYAIEEVLTGRKLLSLATMFKRKATASDTAIGAPLSTSIDDRSTRINLEFIPSNVKPTPGVDLYVGGTEHAVLHLLYARFWHKVLFDLGHVSTAEPFFKLVNQGLILGEDGQKMSKSRGNVVNPDDVLTEYGADAFRLYEMFMGPLEMVKPWSTKGVEGVYRFLGRVWRLCVEEKTEVEFEQSLTTGASSGPESLEMIRLHPSIQDVAATASQLKTLHTCIKKVTEDLDGLRFNTAISALMIFVNDAIAWETKPRSIMSDFLKLLNPFAPHLAEELFAKLNSTFSSAVQSLTYAPWPKFDAALLVEDTLEIPVQVNGKLRDRINVPANAIEQEIQVAALAAEKVKPFVEGKTIKKVIVVPKKLVNIVVA